MNKKQKKNVKVLTGVLAVTAGMVAAAASHASPVFAHANSDANGKFLPDFATFAEEKEYAGNLNVKIMEESIVLLKNKDDALPLAKGSAVSLLGIRSYEPVVGGTGSGGSAGSYVTLSESLTDAGFEINGSMQSFYSSHRHTAAISRGMGSSNSAVVVDGPVSELAEVEDSISLYDDVAVVTIGRVGGEGADLFRTSQSAPDLAVLNADATKHVLQLFDNEIDLIELAKQKCNKVVVLLNTANVMEVAELEEDPDIDAILWIGEGGTTGLAGVGPVLNGDVSPSGRTVDIWPANFKKDPTWFNFGDNSQNNTYDEETKTWSTTYSNSIKTSLVTDSTVASGNKYSLEEEENIYMGYRWYETAAADGVLDQLDIYESAKGTIPADKAGDVYYNRSTGVVYPFGYGLSYTEFEQEIVSSEAEIQAAINGVTNLDEKVQVKVKVTNVGDVAGKEVVQLYIHAPYTSGGIEKAEVSMVSFGKTQLLKPNKSEVVTLDVRAGDLASFDYNDANHNGFSGWELEAGAYELRLQDNSHEEITHLSLTLTAKEFKEDGTVATGLAAADNYNWFSQGDDYDTLLPIKEHQAGVDGVTMKLLSRADLKGTFPTAPTAEELVYPDVVNALLTNSSQAAGSASLTGEGTEFNKYYRYTSFYNGSDDLVTDPWYKTNADIPADWTQATLRESGTQTEVLLAQMSGLDFNNDVDLVPEGHPYAGLTEAAAWVKFMNQLTYAELCALFENGGYRTPGLAAIGKKTAGDQDGPAMLKLGSNGGNYTTNSTTGTTGTNWACEVNIASTFNTVLAHKQGICVGNDSLFMGTSGWYGPAMNTHRSPFSGRNFEYYSQDGVQGGIIAAAVVSGAQSKGCNVYMKHFAMNDQETQRSGIGTFASEQAMREINFKPFEYATKEGNATGFMSAFNRVGAINAFGNYRLLNSMLREEWGFMGAGVTDYYSAGLAKANYLQRGGCEMPLNTGHAYVEAQTGIASTQNKMTGVWDATLRDGKGGVRDGLKDSDEIIPESPTQYYTVRTCAMNIAWVGANTNNIQNGIATVGGDNRAVNAFSFESSFTTQYGVQNSLSVAVDSDIVSSDHSVSYEATNLPEGLSINATTGLLSGVATEVGTFNVSIRAIIDNYILRTATLTLVVNPNATGAVGEEILIPFTPYAVGGTYSGRNITAVGTPSVEGGTIKVVTEDEATEQLPAGSYVAITFTEAGQHSVVVSQSVTYQNGRRTTTVNASIGLLAVTTGEATPGSQSHGGIVSSVINDKGELVITYEDGEAVNLGVVVGAQGATGPQGEKGDTGATGATGAQGEKGEKGDKGDKGDTGATGATGPQGEKGEKGDTGEAGADGSSGCSSSIGAVSTIAMISVLGFALAGYIAIKNLRKKEN